MSQILDNFLFCYYLRKFLLEIFSQIHMNQYPWVFFMVVAAGYVDTRVSVYTRIYCLFIPDPC